MMLPEKIQFFRKRQGLSQEELARAACCFKTVYFEVGARPLSAGD